MHLAIASRRFAFCLATGLALALSSVASHAQTTTGTDPCPQGLHCGAAAPVIKPTSPAPSTSPSSPSTGTSTFQALLFLLGLS